MNLLDGSDAVFAIAGGSSLSALTTARDWIIIVAGGLLALMFVAMLIFTVVVGVSARLLFGTARGLIKGEVTPLVHSARETADRVRGTTSFVSEAVVRPIIRIYGFIAALRRILAVLLGLTSRRKRGE